MLDFAASYGASRLDVCQAGVGGGVVDTANSLATSAPDTARKLYESVLTSDAAEGIEKACAAAGIAALDTAPGETKTGLSAVASAWDAFFAAWLDPLWELFVPLLSVLAVLLLAARLLPRWNVRPNTIGLRRWRQLNRSAWVARHWLAGVGSMVLAAFLLTVGLAWDRLPDENSAREWLLRGSIALALVLTGIVVDMLIASVELHPPTDSHRIAKSVRFIVGVILPILVLLWPASRPSGWLIVLIALLIGGLGAWIVARGNGLQIGMLIEGHGADGTAGTAAAQRVQAKLYEMARTQPGHAGLLIPQATDATIPDDALGLVPDGAAAKAAGALLRALWPKSAWRITVDEVGDGSVHVTVYRNGRYTDAATIRSTDFGMVGEKSSEGSPNSTTAPEQSDESKAALPDVWTGVAAFVLVTLARRYPFLDDGLYRVSEWPSIAAYTAALSETAAEERERLLREAIAFDGNNIAAEIAIQNETKGKDPLTSAQLSSKLGDVLRAFERRVVEQRIDSVDSVESNHLKRNQMWLRLHFNLAVANCNSALALNPTNASKMTPEQQAKIDSNDAAAAAELWTKAVAHLQKVLDQVVVVPSARKRQSEFEATMRGPALALWCLTSAIDVGRPVKPAIPKPVLAPRILKKPPDTLDRCVEEFQRLTRTTLSTRLFRYQRACVYAYLTMDEDVEPDLVAVAGNPDLRKWARTDPSFAAWFRASAKGAAVADRLRDPPTDTILDVAPFSAYQVQLRSRGLTSSTELRRYSIAVARELGLGDLEGRQWQRIANLQRALVDGGLDEKDDAMLLSLLLLENICSVEELKTEIARPGPPENEIAARIATRALTFRSYVAPGKDKFEEWTANTEGPVVASRVRPQGETAASAKTAPVTDLSQRVGDSEAGEEPPSGFLERRARGCQRRVRAWWRQALSKMEETSDSHRER